MEKEGKKGFTLAELLIVIAIIAVLIAIAIPTFAGALRNAKLQTDHANLRNAYAMAMAGNLVGYLDVNGVHVDPTDPSAITTYTFQKDGTLVAGVGTGDPYRLQVTYAGNECSASIPCKTNSHEQNSTIEINYDNSTNKWDVEIHNP